jgi:hypothetical protein
MQYPKQTKQCSRCEGYKRVAVITKGRKLFEGLINKPLPMTFAKAREHLRTYKGRDAGALSMFVRELANNLDTVPCPWCEATGIAFTLQQLSPEEAAQAREAEEAAS